MEVKMTPVKVTEIPGFVKERVHDEWAKLAIGEFVESGEEAALLSIPKFGVQEQTVVNCLRMYGNTRGVKVRNVSRKKPMVGHDTYLIRKEALGGAKR